MNDSVNVTLEKRVQGGENEDLGNFNLPAVPREGEYVEKDGSQYRVQSVVYSEGQTKLVVS